MAGKDRWWTKKNEFAMLAIVVGVSLLGLGVATLAIAFVAVGTVYPFDQAQAVAFSQLLLIGLLCLVGGAFGSAVGFLVRSELSKSRPIQRVCPGCGHSVGAGPKHCPECGARLGVEPG